MFVDASALVAMIAGEDDALDLLRRIEATKPNVTSPIAVWEAGVAVARRLGIPISQGGVEVSRFLAEVEIELIGMPPEVAAPALDAFDRFGKGRHPAKLNMGDCFSYACARHLGQSLLYKGDDFALTDIIRA